MNHKKLLLQMIGLTLVMLLLGACGAPQPAPTPTPVPPTNTPIPPTPTPLRGTWVTTLTEAESDLYHGQWEQTFADDGRYTVLLAGVKVVEGRYTLTQEQLVMTDESGIYKCTGHETATYKWSLEKDTDTDSD